jgi:hypothetical protein
MKRVALMGISVAGILFVIVAFGWLIHQNRKALDAQCILNLQCIDGAKIQWGLEHKAEVASNTVPTTEDIHDYNSRNQDPMPVCPRGGTYIIGLVSEPPRCTFPGHVLTDETAKWPEEFDIHHSYPHPEH